MVKRILLTLTLVALILSVSFAQSKKNVPKKTQKEPEKIDRGYVTFGLGYGILSFKGDLGAEQKLTTFNNFRGGFNINIEKRFGKVLGVGFNTLIGKISQSERTPTRNLNFESPVKQFGLNVSGQFDIKQETAFAPFISVGIGTILFNPSSDLKDKDGKNYVYWSDGTIRDLPEKDAAGKIIKANKDSSKYLRRDYVYESKITTANDSMAIKKSSIVIPLTLGLKFKMGDRLDTRLAATYNLTQTDYMDGFVGGGKDGFIYLSMGLNYTFSKKYVPKAEQVYEGIDFAALLKEDNDDDGVLDDVDQCQQTPNGVQVDAFGCPLDSDNDGIPDYIDKEKETKAGAIVNQFGVTMTDEMISLQRAYRDSVVAERVSRFYDAPSKETLKDIDKQIAKKQSTGNHANITGAIPKTYQFADKDGNGVLSSTEISGAIDSFFEGEIDINVQTLLGLIDFFFEQ